MSLANLVIITLGLCLFEVVSGIDNAVVNADVLRTMSPKGRRWFLVWGIFFGVFLVRGFLPWLIVWEASPSLGPVNALLAAFSSNPSILEAVEKSSPVLLVGGGIFLIFLFLHWLFLEEKAFGLKFEPFFSRQGVWFFAIVSVILSFIIWWALQINPFMAFGAAMGASAYFIVDGFKQQAADTELAMKGNKSMSDISKLIFLEILDATFSVDGVIGAFSFTLSVPLIIIGNGLGALIVRQLTIKGASHIKKYIFLKNGAMYSILFLGLIMVLDSFGLKTPAFLSPAITFLVVGFFFVKSRLHLKNCL